MQFIIGFLAICFFIGLLNFIMKALFGIGYGIWLLIKYIIGPALIILLIIGGILAICE